MKNKFEYHPPLIEIMIVAMEYGIATGSVVEISPGGPENRNRPETEDWVDGWNTNTDFDL